MNFLYLIKYILPTEDLEDLSLLKSKYDTIEEYDFKEIRNRYDLDEIDIFLEGNHNNPMFFNMSGLPQTLAYGKHYFNISILNSVNQEYRLRPESRVLFVFKSGNNVVL